MRNLAHMSAKGRIANALLFLKTKFGLTPEGSIAINISRNDMASYTGTTYETLFRMMNELMEENILRMEGKNIFIQQEDKLMEYTNDL
jgi:CRP/FNR family transcriptional regulator